MELDQLGEDRAPAGVWETAHRPHRIPPQYQARTDPMGNAWEYLMPLSVVFSAAAAGAATAVIKDKNYKIKGEKYAWNG